MKKLFLSKSPDHERYVNSLKKSPTFSVLCRRNLKRFEGLAGVDISFLRNTRGRSRRDGPHP
jgi:hypothetical protein